MRLTAEQIDKMCLEIVEDMSIEDLMQYVYEDLVYLNLHDDDLARENWSENLWRRRMNTTESNVIGMCTVCQTIHVSDKGFSNGRD